MGLYLRGKIYWFSIQYQGKRIQQSLTTGNKRLAEKLYAKVLTDIIEGRYFEIAKAKKITFKEMIDKYMQNYQKKRDLTTVKPLLLFFKDYTLFQITAKIINDYRHMRLETVKPATIYQELALLRRMFNVAIKDWEWLTDNPASKLSFSVGNKNARDRWLTFDEEQRLLLNAYPEWLKTLLIIALHTGMRRGEILYLKWINIDFKKRLILVERSKNGEKRSIPMSNTLNGVLNNLKVRDISGKLFPITGHMLRHSFDKVVKKAEIEDFRFHDLRHTFATRLVQNGVDLYRVKELLGHKTITMTMRYAHHYPESLRSSIEVLDRCYNSATFNENSN